MRVGGREVEDTEELQIALIRQFSDDGVIPLRVRRDGAERSLTLRVDEDRRSLTEPGKLLPASASTSPPGTPTPWSMRCPATVPALAQDCMPGIAFWRWMGSRWPTAQSSSPWSAPRPGRDISIEVERAGERQRLVASVPRIVEQGRAIGRLGITLEEGPRAGRPA